MTNLLRKFLTVVPVGVLLAAGAFAQNTTAFEGDVKGPDGKPLPGAQIRIERQDVKGIYKVKTDKKGLVLQGQSSHLVLEEGQFDDTTLDTVVSWIDKYSDNSPVVTASEMIKLKEQKNHRPIVDKPGIQPVK